MSMTLSNSELLYWPVDDMTQAINAKSRSYLRNALQVPAFRLVIRTFSEPRLTYIAMCCGCVVGKTLILLVAA